MNSMDRLEAVRRKPVRRVIGLMSGTSADGIDAALVELTRSGASRQVRTLAFVSVPYERSVRETVLGLRDATATDLCRWNLTLGELFADAALAVVARAGIPIADVDLVGSHGQTVVHVPRERGRGAATLQIAEPCVIAERTGLPVVADFRQRDVAAGGEGAPLVPWVDWLLLRPERGARLAQNLGGVGNVTFVAQEAGEVVAFDTGPANGPLDAAAALVTRGERHYDDGGRLASAGRIHERVVESLLSLEWFRRPPPRSLSRETFGEPFVAEIVRAHPEMELRDLLATLTEFVARATVAAWREHLPRLADATDAIVSGGGVHNPVMMSRLRELSAPLAVRSSAELGIDPDAKEAIAFAVLADETLAGRPANLPRVTGATRPVILGKLVP